MSGFDSSSPVDPAQSRPLESSATSRNGKRSLHSGLSTQRGLSILGLVLLLLGLGFGWHWWQAGQTAAKQSPGAGKPAGIPVKLATTQTATVSDSSEYVGSLESRQSVILKPEIAGRVSDIMVKPGDRVSKGDPLIQVKPQEQEAQLASNLAAVNSARAARANSASQLQSEEANRIAKQAAVTLQEKKYKRYSYLVEQGAYTKQQLDEVASDRSTAISELKAIDKTIQAARDSLAESSAALQQAQANADLTTEQLRRTTTFAPFDGVVGDVPVKLGQLVATTETLTTVTQNESLELKLQIPLEKSSELREGLQVQLTNAKGDTLSTGQINFISPQADTTAQSILAKAVFDNSAGKLRDGQFVRARVIWKRVPGILVPSSAISRLGGETFVFLAQPIDDKCKEVLSKSPQAAAPGAPASAPPSLVARQRLVKLGSIQGNSYNVLDGLKSGEQIVSSGILNLSECAPILSMPPDQAATAP